MSGLLALAEARFSQRDAAAESDALRAARSEAMRLALSHGLPTQRQERWKYTSLRALGGRDFSSTSADNDVAALADALAAIPAPRLVFVNGRFEASSSALPDFAQPLSQLLQRGDDRDTNFLQRRFDRGDETFAQLNTALASEGAVLRIPAGLQAGECHVVCISTAGNGAHMLRHLVALAPGASLSLIEHHLAVGEAEGLGNSLWHLHLDAGAHLQHLRVQNGAGSHSDIARYDAVLGSDAHYTRADLELGHALSRVEINTALQGQGARFVSRGAQRGDGRRHSDVRLDVQHIAPGTSCDLDWRGLADERSRIAFHGGITIRAGADGTEAHLSNKNLLLSAQAEVDTQPLMEIHADEVVASHGATVGQLDDKALFYLRSRGLPQAQARHVLMQAFLRAPFAAIEPTLFDRWIAPLLDDGIQA